MAAMPPGWYPDPVRGGGMRYFDGTAWTSHHVVGPPGGPPTWGASMPGTMPPRRSGMSPGAIVGIVVGSVLVLSMLAAVAIPVFLNQRSRAAVADLRYLSCAHLAADAVAFSGDIERRGDPVLVDVDELAMVEDARDGLVLPTREYEDTLVLACTGTGAFEDGSVTPLYLEFTIDSRGELYVWYWRS